jgi:hypothetical protein
VLVQATATGVIEFGCEAVLSREYLWDGLLTRMPACGRSPVLACSICMLLRLHAACAPEDTLDLLKRQGMPLDALLQHLDIRQQVNTFAPDGAGVGCDPGFNSKCFFTLLRLHADVLLCVFNICYDASSLFIHNC